MKKLFGFIFCLFLTVFCSHVALAMAESDTKPVCCIRFQYNESTRCDWLSAKASAPDIWDSLGITEPITQVEPITRNRSYSMPVPPPSPVAMVSLAQEVVSPIMSNNTAANFTVYRYGGKIILALGRHNDSLKELFGSAWVLTVSGSCEDKVYFRKLVGPIEPCDLWTFAPGGIANHCILRNESNGHFLATSPSTQVVKTSPDPKYWVVCHPYAVDLPILTVVNRSGDASPESKENGCIVV